MSLLKHSSGTARLNSGMDGKRLQTREAGILLKHILPIADTTGRKIKLTNFLGNSVNLFCRPHSFSKSRQCWLWCHRFFNLRLGIEKTDYRYRAPENNRGLINS